MGLLRRFRTLYRVATKLGVSHALRLLKRKLSYTREDQSDASIEKLEGINRISAENLISKMFTDHAEIILNLELEYADYMEEFRNRQSLPRKDFFNAVFDLGPNLGKFLYIAIRLIQPEKVIETGVAAGASTNTLLFALHKNGGGSLTSIDVTHRVGELIEERLKDLWDLQIINPNKPQIEYLNVLKTNSIASIFLHDSDHSLEWQISELDGVCNVLKNCKIIAFDDVSFEFLEHVLTNYPDCEINLFDELRKRSAVILLRNKTGDTLAK